MIIQPFSVTMAARGKDHENVTPVRHLNASDRRRCGSLQFIQDAPTQASGCSQMYSGSDLSGEVSL